MPRDGKSELRLPRASPLDANHHQGAGIEERGQRSQPGLVDVLRTEISEHGVRNMALQELRGPALEVSQEALQRIQALRRVVTAQQLGRGWGRACARIQQSDIHFAPGERLIRSEERRVGK